jgi:hypothetical protein
VNDDDITTANPNPPSPSLFKQTNDQDVSLLDQIASRTTANSDGEGEGEGETGGNKSKLSKELNKMLSPSPELTSVS